MFERWQEFEEHIQEVFETHGFNTEFRRVFQTPSRKYEIDLVATRYDRALGVDCKLYGETWYRESRLRKEARLHTERCHEYSQVSGRPTTPIIVSWLDDNLLIEDECLFVPYPALNDLLSNLDYYMSELGEAI